MAQRLQRIHQLAMATGQVYRFIVFGSFVTSRAAPKDVDVFLLMNDTFDLNNLVGEAGILWNHADAQAYFGASVFWMRRLSAFPKEMEAVAHWQIRRDGDSRGIVEIVTERA